MSIKGLQARSKVWIERRGRPVFGDGKAEILETIRRRGTLSEAAKKLGMSYRAMWGRIRRMEERLGARLVERSVGGRGGGGAHLTPVAEDLLSRYEKFRRNINRMVDERFRNAFGK